MQQILHSLVAPFLMQCEYSQSCVAFFQVAGLSHRCLTGWWMPAHGYSTKAVCLCGLSNFWLWGNNVSLFSYDCSPLCLVGTLWMGRFQKGKFWKSGFHKVGLFFCFIFDDYILLRLYLLCQYRCAFLMFRLLRKIFSYAVKYRIFTNFWIFANFWIFRIFMNFPPILLFSFLNF